MSQFRFHALSTASRQTEARISFSKITRDYHHLSSWKCDITRLYWPWFRYIGGSARRSDKKLRLRSLVNSLFIIDFLISSALAIVFEADFSAACDCFIKALNAEICGVEHPFFFAKQRMSFSETFFHSFSHSSSMAFLFCSFVRSFPSSKIRGICIDDIADFDAEIVSLRFFFVWFMTAIRRKSNYTWSTRRFYFDFGWDKFINNKYIYSRVCVFLF